MISLDSNLCEKKDDKDYKNDVETQNLKRPLNTEQDELLVKKKKLHSEKNGHTETVDSCTNAPNTSKVSTNIRAHQHRSPKKRLEVATHNSSKIKDKFIYGNYSKYYGYRNKDKDFHDIRLDVFGTHESLFIDKDILDIGCNSGFITMKLAKLFPIKHITGIDIDQKLVTQASKIMKNHRKAIKESALKTFPFNVSFIQANYVLRDDVLLEIEREQFDVILCLSVTKWIHLNFGDAGLKQSFRRMFLQLRQGGKLILEAQPFDNYSRRKKMTENIFENYKAMAFFPENFTNYLLSSDVGFTSVSLLGVPNHCAAGFKRPIQIFNKA